MARRIAILLALGLTAFALAGQERESQILFIGENEFGKVWANLSLTRQRDAEPYLPMVVAVYNKAREPVTIDRETIRLSDLDDIVYSMPTVKQLRKSYKRIAIDYRTVSYSGIPWESWWTSGHLAQSNFFPDLRATRGNTLIDRVTLRRGHAMFDLLYFERPRTLELNKPFFLEVIPEGWEVPIRLRLHIS